MPVKHCRGHDKKIELINDYIIEPLSYIKLLPGQEKQGCCGLLRDRYYVFEYQNKANPQDKGNFFVGYDCGEQFLDLLNIDKSEYKLFNPLANGNHGGGGEGVGGAANTQHRNPLNQEVYDAINLICVAWNRPPKYSIKNILDFVRNQNNPRTKDWAVEKVNELISHDWYNRTLVQIVEELREEYNLRNFTFNLMNEIIERLEIEEGIENHIM